MPEEKNRNDNNNGLLVGVFTSIACFLLTFTYIVPLVSVMPGAMFEELASGLLLHGSDKSKGVLTIFLILFVLLSLIGLALRAIYSLVKRGEYLSRAGVVLVMLICYFISHPLGFYLYWASIGFSGDGQLIFSTIYTYPLSGLGFILIGWLIDIVKATAVKKQIQ